jgi:iron complex transport system ATP-binding protein
MQLRIHNLTIRIAKRLLVADLNLQVNAGECWCIIGRNGAGKTTLLRCLAGLQALPADPAAIVINDLSLNLWPLQDLAKLRSYLPQGRNDAFAYRVIETVLGARHPYHDGNYWESEQDVELAYAALAELDVADLAQRDVRSLSGGERQRVAIAALLAQDAHCMLLDEPTNSLDLSHQIGVMELLAQRCTQQQKTALMVSHDLNLAYRFATHALLLMPDGSWLAGPASQTMTEAALSQCLQHPIEIILHANQRLFVPKNRMIS